MASIKLKSVAGIDYEFSRFVCEVSRRTSMSDCLMYSVIGFTCNDCFRVEDHLIKSFLEVEEAMDELDRLNDLLEEARRQEALEGSLKDNSSADLLGEVNVV